MLKHKKILYPLVAASLVLGGCISLGQIRSDYNLGQSHVLVEGEMSPRNAAESLVMPILPFIPEPLKPIGGVAVGFLAVLGTYLRGRRVRRGQPINANPITGKLGSKIGAEGILQSAATLAAGIFEVGPAGSGLKRGWKVLVAGLVPVGLLMIPGIRDLVAQNTELTAGFVAVGSALIMGLQKELQKVEPIKEIK